MTVGDRIRKAREEKGISQTDLAKMVGISKQTLYKYENNIVTNIPSNKIEKIADKLDVSEAYIMGWEEPDYLYTNENAEFLIEVTKMAKNKDFVDRMTKYMSLINEQKNQSIDDMIDFMYEKGKKDEK